MSSQMIHVYCADGETDTKAEESKLVWKVVLRTGTWKLRPGPGGVKLKADLNVVRDGGKKGDIVLTELKRSFDAKAKEYVTVPLSSHGNEEAANTGYVRELRIQDVAGEDGSQATQSLLWAGIEFTDSEVARKVQEKSIASVSGGILFDYERTEDGEKFPQILDHVCLTNKPWINGTGEFTSKLPEGVMASDEPDDLPVGFAEEEVELSPEAPLDPLAREKPVSGTVVWKPEDGFQFQRDRVQRALEEYRRTLMSSVPRSAELAVDFPYYHVDDVAGGKALIRSGYGSEREAWVATFKLTEDGAEVEPFMNWTPVKQEYVAASEDPSSHPAPSAAQRRPAFSPGRRADLTELQRAQAERDARIGRGRANTTTGGAMKLSDLLGGLELSEEQREAIERADAEQAQKDARLAQLEADKRKEQATAMLSQLDGTPFDSPGVKKYVEDVVLSDDGGTALNLSEGTESGQRTQPVARTATEILKGLFDRLPKDTPNVTLSQQARDLPDDPKPPAEASTEKVELSAREKSLNNMVEMHQQGIDISGFVSADEFKAIRNGEIKIAEPAQKGADA
jgi:hypothetical protein